MKNIKAQFNKQCIAGLQLEMQTAALYSGYSRSSCIEVTPAGINIQPGVSNPIYFTTLTLKGPMHTQSSILEDFLPGPSNLTPRKYIDIPALESVAELTIATSAIAVILGSASGV